MKVLLGILRFLYKLIFNPSYTKDGYMVGVGFMWVKGRKYNDIIITAEQSFAYIFDNIKTANKISSILGGKVVVLNGTDDEPACIIENNNDTFFHEKPITVECTNHETLCPRGNIPNIGIILENGVEVLGSTKNNRNNRGQI